GGASAGAAVRVLEADDVVLAEVAARLHLDDLEVYLAGVGQAVRLAQRDVGALVLAEQDLLVAAGHLGGAGDDDPVLRAVVMHLQAQRGTRLDHDALDLETRARVDAVVPAPRAVHLAVQRVLVAFAGAQLADDLLDVVAARAVGDHYRIRRLDDDDVV